MSALKSCLVSFTDLDGVCHTAEVTAESLNEAVVLGLAATAQDGGVQPGDGTPVEVQVRAPIVKHTTTPSRVRRWLDSSTPSPRDKLLKERLRALMPQADA